MTEEKKSSTKKTKKADAAEAPAVKTLEITLVRSLIGVPEKQIRVVRALGLKKRLSSVQHAATVTVMGMVNKVSHLLAVKEV